MPKFSQSGWKVNHGEAIHFNSNYLYVAENLVDPAHVSFVHPTTLGSSASENVPVEFETDGDVIVAWRWIRNSPPIGFFKEIPRYKTNVDRWHYNYLHPPSIAVINFGSIDSIEQIEENERFLVTQLFALHFLTPFSSNRTIDLWMHLRNVAVGDEDASEKINSMFRVTFTEDKKYIRSHTGTNRSSQKSKSSLYRN